MEEIADGGIEANFTNEFSEKICLGSIVVVENTCARSKILCKRLTKLTKFDQGCIGIT